jgi:hypothetical protein
MKCKYFDCGWCYAPNNVETNANQGQCNYPECCPYLMDNLKMIEPDYKIEEWYDGETLKVYFRIWRMKPSPNVVTRKRFDTLEEATEVVRMLRKYKERVFHYVEN